MGGLNDDDRKINRSAYPVRYCSLGVLAKREEGRMVGIVNAFRLWILRVDQWLKNLSPLGYTTLVLFVAVLFVAAAYFGLVPSKHIWPNPHAIFNW
jgi:hypothetical protein